MSEITDDLFKKRIVCITNEIDDANTQELISQIISLMLDSSKKPIVFLINTGGGDVYGGFAIYDLIKSLKVKTIGIVLGAAFSMGSIIFCACQERYISKNGVFLLHQPKIMELDMPIKGMDIRAEAKEMANLHEKFIDVYAEISNLTRKKVENLITNETFLNPQQTLDMGFTTKIIDNIAPILARQLDK